MQSEPKEFGGGGEGCSQGVSLLPDWSESISTILVEPTLIIYGLVSVISFQEERFDRLHSNETQTGKLAKLKAKSDQDDADNLNSSFRAV